MIDQKINYKYVISGVLAVIFTWILHEFTHWATSELLGYETIMRLNGASPVNGSIPNAVHRAIISISAPIITVLQGLITFLYLRNRPWNKYIYTFLFTAFFMRLLAGFMNFIMANDEARVSLYLGLGTFTIPIITCAFLFYMIYKISRQYRLKRSFHAWTAILILVLSSILILSDQFLKIRII